uniref:Uncharacterized protein n=1 Tax=Fagus sylvatica TaxID=28930 RepID=A0A2N9E159_FAGSY
MYDDSSPTTMFTSDIKGQDSKHPKSATQTNEAASDGARVSILARSISKLEEAKQAIRLSTGIDVAVFVADVRDYDAVSKAINETEPIDVLIYGWMCNEFGCAGVGGLAGCGVACRGGGGFVGVGLGGLRGGLWGGFGWAARWVVGWVSVAGWQ